MTEDEWLASHDPAAMVDFVLRATVPVRTRWHGPREAKRFAVSPRKWQLIACAALRRVADALPTSVGERPLYLLEQAADGKPVWDELNAIDQELGEIPSPPQAGTTVAVMALRAACSEMPDKLGQLLNTVSLARRVFPALLSFDLTEIARVFEQSPNSEPPQQAELVRCILGNPFRPVVFAPPWLAANDAAALRIAQVIYDNRAFEDLPILADALEEAGCAEAAMLHHCRASGLHARGCWVVDGVLGRQ